MPGKARGRPCSAAGLKIPPGQTDPGATSHPPETLAGSLDTHASVSLSWAHAAPTPAQVSLRLAKPPLWCKHGPVGFFQWIFAWQPHLLRSCCGVCGGPWMDLTLRHLHLEAGERRNYVDGCTRSARPLPHAHTEAPWWRRTHRQGRCPFGKGLVT